MQTGLCPKCGRDKVYLRHNYPMNTSSTLHPLASLNSPLDSYLCTHCGYSEVYSAGAKLVDSSGLAAAMITAGEWHRVDAAPRAGSQFVECQKCGARVHGGRCECCSNTASQPLLH